MYEDKPIAIVHRLSKAGGGPFIGPRGGKWADAAHTITYGEPTAEHEREVADRKGYKVQAFSDSRYNSYKGGKRHTLTDFVIHDPQEPGGLTHHKYTGIAGASPTERRSTAIRLHKERHNIQADVRHANLDTQTERHNLGAAKAAGVSNFERKPENFGLTTPVVGKPIKITDRKNATGFREVEADAVHGHYAAHDGTVTHLPTGIAVQRFDRKADAKSLAKHLHEALGARMFPGKGFAEMPSFKAAKDKADMAEMHTAIKGHAGKLHQAGLAEAAKRYAKQANK